jgi:hypothetical protein
MRKPHDDVVCIVRIEFANMIDPRAGFCGIAKLERRRPIQIINAGADAFLPAAVKNDSVFDKRGHAWPPCHLLNRLMTVEP